MNDRFVPKRLMNIFFMLLVTLGATTIIAVLKKRYIDEIFIYLLIDLLFFALLLFVLERNRMHKIISGNRETSFQKILLGYLISWAIVLPGAFLPEFLKPMLIVPILMAAFGNQGIAMCIGIFCNSIVCLILGSTVQELILYCLMTLFGCMLAGAMESSKKQLWYQLIILCLSTILPPIFYYLTYYEVKMSLFIYGVIEGALIVIFLIMSYPKIVAVKEAEIIDTLEDIIDESYPMNRELYKFSKADYKHAKRVSRVSAKCARLVNADDKLCAAAGFYYRIGILEVGSIVENGVRIAQNECFPEEVIRIISEYNGEQVLPSSIESAIVHMVDGLIKKIEVFDSTTMSSEWNQDMVIYQTLNDFSAQGLYDKSGLSMNMFLKIREYLVNEEALL